MNFQNTIKAAILLMQLSFLPQIQADPVLNVTQFTTDGHSGDVLVATDFHNDAIAIYVDESTVLTATYSANGGPWGTRVPLTDDAASPALAMDQSGTALAAWVGSGGSVIQTAFFSNGTWSTPTPDPLDSSGSGFDSIAVAMNGSGKGLATWISNTGDVSASFFSNGAWSTPPTLIGTGFTGGPLLECAYSANGTAVVMFSLFFGGENMTAINYNGTMWLSPVPLDSNNESGPSLGIDANGNAIGVWVSNDPTLNVVTSRYNGTSWSSPLQILSNGINNSPPSIAVAPDGTAIAVWVDEAFDVQMSFFNGSNWSPTPIFVAANAQPSSVDFEIPTAVTMDAAGNAFISWPSATQALMGVLLPKGGVLGTPFVITTEPVGSFYGSLHLALSDPSVGWAVWNENTVEASNTFGTAALFAPSPPTDPASFVCKNKFATQTDRINVITFSPSTDPTAFYQITRDGVLIATIPPTGPFSFEDHNRCKGVTYTYTITAISSLAVPSTPITITIS